MSEAIRDKKCSVAFARLIDGVSYSGMAEAEAANANRSTSRYALDATEAMKLFKTACKVGEGE